jgi:hypothetical protein
MLASEEFRLKVQGDIESFHPWNEAVSRLSCEDQALFGHHSRRCIPHLNERNRAYAACSDPASKRAARERCEKALAPVERDMRAVLRPYLTSVVRDRHDELLLALDACLQACAETASRERLADWEVEMRKELAHAEDVILERGVPAPDS